MGNTASQPAQARQRASSSAQPPRVQASGALSSALPRRPSALGSEWDAQISQVYPWLFIGNHEAADNLGLVRKLDVRCFINCTNQKYPSFLAQERDLTCLHVPVEDDARESISLHFDRATQWAASKDGYKLLIFCMAGISRSATIVLAILMKNCSMSLAAAFSVLRAARPKVRPNKGFLVQLLQYELKLRGANSMRRAGNGLVPLDAPQRAPAPAPASTVHGAARAASWQPAPPQHAWVSDALVSCRVRVLGLERRRDLNGRLGTVLNFDPAAERYRVRLDHGEEVAVRGANLERAAAGSRAGRDSPLSA